jgi:hypothetical protein
MKGKNMTKGRIFDGKLGSDGNERSETRPDTLLGLCGHEKKISKGAPTETSEKGVLCLRCGHFDLVHLNLMIDSLVEFQDAFDEK